MPSASVCTRASHVIVGVEFRLPRKFRLNSHLAFMKDHKFNFTLYFILIFPLEPINTLVYRANAHRSSRMQWWTKQHKIKPNGLQEKLAKSDRETERGKIKKQTKSIPNAETIDGTYWLEVSTWELKFSLDFHFARISFCSCRSMLIFRSLSLYAPTKMHRSSFSPVSISFYSKLNEKRINVFFVHQHRFKRVIAIYQMKSKQLISKSRRHQFMISSSRATFFFLRQICNILMIRFTN